MFVPDKEFLLPMNVDTHEEFLEFIGTFPSIISPGVFGFHQNADITKDINESNNLFNCLLLCSSDSGAASGGSSLEETL